MTITSIIFAIVCGILLLAFVLLNTKQAQGYLLQQTTQYLSTKIGSPVRISAVEYNFFTEFQFSGIEVQDKENEDLLLVDDVYVRFRLLPLLKQKLIINTLTITKPQIYMAIDTVGISNFQYILDAFSKEKKDSTEGDFVFDIRNVNIQDAEWKLTRKGTIAKPKGFDANNIHVEHLNALLHIEKKQNDSIIFDISKCNFEEKSGFSMKNLDANASFGKNFLHVNELSMQLPSSVIEFEQMSVHYVREEKMNSLLDLLNKSSVVFTTKKVLITGKDIACFVPSMRYLDFPIEIEADVNAASNNIDLKKFIVRYGKDIYIDAAVQLAGINNINELFIYANFNSISAKVPALENVIADITRKPFVLPKEVRNLRQVEYTGNISGFFTNLVAYGKLRTDIGTVSTDIMLEFDTETKDLSYSGNLRSPQLQLKKMLGSQAGFGNAQFRIDVNGTRTRDNKYSGVIKGNVQSIDFNKYTYKNIQMDGNYTSSGFVGKIELNDDNGRVKFDGDIDFSRKIPLMSFDAQIEKLRPFNLHLTKDNPTLSVSLNIASSIQGSSIDNIIGNVLINNIQLQNETDTLNIQQLDIVSSILGKQQNIRISSDILEASIDGTFTLSSIADNLLSVIHTQLPDITVLNKKKRQSGNNFTLQATIQPIEKLSNILEWKVSTDGNSEIQAWFNDYEETFSVSLQSKNIRINKTEMYAANIKIENPNKKIQADAQIELKLPKDSLTIKLSSTTWQKNTDLTLHFENHYGKELSGTLQSQVSVHKNEQNEVETAIQIAPSELMVNDSVWYITPSSMLYTKDRLAIDNFSLQQRDKFIRIDGVASKNIGDIIRVDINQFNLEYLSELVRLKGIQLSGIATGFVSIEELFNRPILNADMDATDFGLNGAPFGHVKALGSYNYEKEQIDINGIITNKKGLKSEVNGYISPVRNEMLLRAEMKEIDLGFLDPYLSSFAKEIEGEATGEIFIGGDMRAIEVWGKAFVNKAKLNIDFLKTDVYFSDYVTLTKNSIVLSDINITDKKGNKGKVNGKITHKSFSEFAFNINFLLNNMLVYNTTEIDNPDFYGTVYATGVANIYGDVDLISIDVVGKTEQNTVFYIPLNTSSSALEGNFVTFVNRKQLAATPRKNRRKQQTESTESKLKISVQIEATPDAEVILILDDRTREYIQGTGNGNIRLNLEPNENLKMYGNYTLSQGKYFFVMQNAIRKTFEIRDGSTIAWDGNPYNAGIDIMATYQVSASLIDLLDQSMLQDVKRLTVPVLCKAHLTGELQRPSIKLDLELPTADDELKRRVQNIVNSDEMMNNQMVFLLMLGRFYNPQLSNNSQTNTAGMATMIASATLSSQLNYWLSHISNDVNLGVNYRQNEGIDFSSREIEVALTTNLLDDRLVINSNIGYKEDAFTENNFIGDFDVEYKINRSGRLRLKAYSHSNDKYYIRNALTTQGVGILYREDFNSGKNLWEYYRNVFKKKEEQAETTETTKE